MSITFACEQCGKSFTIDDKFAGKKGKCKQCGAVMPIPEAGSIRHPTTHADLESAASRRSASRAEASRGDVYGFEDSPPLANRGLPAGIEEVEAGSPVAARFKARSPGRYDPPRARKKGAGDGAVGTIIKVAVGLFVGLVGLGVVGAVVMNLRGLSSRKDLESLVQERVELNQQLASLLAGVDDVASAQTASPRANQALKGIAANLRKLKVIKGLKSDLESLKRQFQVPQQQAEQQVVQQVLRIHALDGAWDALDINAAFEELSLEEDSINGRPHVAIPPMPVIARQMPPPVIRPGPPPGANRPSSNRLKSNSRKAPNRPGTVPPG